MTLLGYFGCKLNALMTDDYDADSDDANDSDDSYLARCAEHGQCLETQIGCEKEYFTRILSFFQSVG